MKARRNRGTSFIFKTIAVGFGLFWGTLIWLQYRATSTSVDCLAEGKAAKDRKEIDLHASTRKYEEIPTVKFVMVLGLEGTGHHFFQSLYLSSPSYREIQRYGVTNIDMPKLMMNLYNNYEKESGIWSAPCANDELRNVTNAIERSFRLVVESLRKIQENILLRKRQGGRMQFSPDTPTAVSVNSIEDNPFGMMSFPNFMGECKPLQYPDLGSLYAACNEAQVQCKHIVMYRDPYQTVRSTTIKRKPNMTESAKLRQIQILSTMLDVIHGQMLDFPEHLAACWNYSGNLLQNNDAIDVGRLLGWDENSLKSYYSKESAKHNLSVTLDMSEKSNMVSPALQLFMKRLTRANNRVASTCRQQLHQLI